jgi:tetratricopeptide (TPR) repeat protein
MKLLKTSLRFKSIKTAILTSILVVFGLLLHAQNNRNLYKQGDSLLDLKDYLKAKKVFQQIINSETKPARAHNGRGICFEQINMADSAALDYQKAISLDSNYAAPYANLGNYFLSKRDFDLAKKMLKKYVSLKPKDGEGFLRIGFIFSNNEQNDSAAYYYDQALKTDSTLPMAYLYRALLYYKMQDSALAMQLLNTSIKKNLANEMIYVLKGTLHQGNGQADEALSSFTKSLQMNQKYLNGYINRANLHLMIGNNTEALKDTEAALKLDSTNLNAINTNAWANYYLQNYPIASTMVSKGISKQPQNSKLWQLMALLRTREKDYKKALECIEKAMNNAPNSTELFTNRIEILLLNNTHPEVFRADSQDFFKDIQASRFEELVKQTLSKDRYNYKKLHKKFTTNYQSLGLDDFFMLYLGFTQQKNYSPYQLEDVFKASKIEEKLQNGDFEGGVTACKKLLKKNPFILKTYLMLALAYSRLGKQAKFEEYYFKHYAFLRSILATGNGKSAESAYLVASPSDEYNLIHFLGLEAIGQQLASKDAVSYDILECQSGEEKLQLWFNIEIIMRKVSQNFK